MKVMEWNGAPLAHWVEANKAEVEAALGTSGASLLRGFPIDTAEACDEFFVAFGYEAFTYEQSLSNAVRVNHTPRVFTANEAPPDVEIFVHHEMAQTPVYPSTLFFFCVSAAKEGGATPLVRSDRVWEKLKAAEPEAAERLRREGVRYTTVMPGSDDKQSGQGRSWRSTLSVDSRGAAEAKLQALGYTWRWRADDSLAATTPVLPAVLELPDGARTFFNQLTSAFLGWKGVRDNPSAFLSLGTGEPISAALLETASRITYDLAEDLNWRDGDIAIVDNRRVMHGRRPYRGERKRRVLVAMAR